MPPPTLLILPGDGIGPEVMAEVRKVIAWFAANRGLAFTIEEDLATSTTDPGNDTICTSTGSWSQACFYADGDWFGVKDTFADTLSGVVAWEVVNDNGRIVRAGHIWNNAGSDAGWRFKNRDIKGDAPPPAAAAPAAAPVPAK